VYHLGRISIAAILILFMSIAIVYAEKSSWVVPGRYAKYRVSIVNSSIPGLQIGDAGYIKWLVRTVYSDRAEIEIIVDVVPQLGNIKIDSMSLSLLVTNTSVRTWIYTENMEMYIVGSKTLEYSPKGQLPLDQQRT